MENNSDKIQVLLLESSGITFAIPLSLVIRAIPAQEITPANSNNPIIRGIIDFKGYVMPVISIDARFGIQEKDLSVNDKFVIIEQNNNKIALIANNIRDIVEINPKNNQKTDGMFPGLLSVNLLGIEQGIVYLYNPETLFTSSDNIDIQKLSEL